MGVLPAVLPYARRVARDVAGIERRAVERRREEQDELLIAANEVLLDRGHRARGAGGVGGPRKHGPRLRDRIDTAFGVRGGAERRPVVEIGAPVPVARPGLALPRRPQRVRERNARRACLPRPRRWAGSKTRARPPRAAGLPGTG